MQRCWAEKSADRPTFPEIVSELGTFRLVHALSSQMCALSMRQVVPGTIELQ